MHARMLRLGPWAALLALAAGCDVEPDREAEPPPPVVFDTGAVRIETDADTFRLRVELARTADQRAYGLMERASLPREAGMLFLYDEPQPPDAGFWMFRTRIPLDIAFLDGEGRIVAVRGMEPCESPDPRWCPSYEPGVPYAAALEVNRGWLEARGVGTGDRVVLVEGGAAGR